MRLTVVLLTALLAAPLGGNAQWAPGTRAAAAPRVPRVSFDGPALTYDFPAVQIGAAEYEEGPTGATVLLFRKPVMAAVDVRGGAPGTIFTDLLRLGSDKFFVSAITLAGGSAYGLSVATGVANALKERAANPGNWKNIAVVPGAIIFDLGLRRYNSVTPDETLGRAALDGARSGWAPLGARGAGRFAMQGYYFGRDEWQHSGQGAAFRRSGETKVLVITVVNAAGSVVDRKGRLMRCSHPVAGDCGAISERLAQHLAALGAAKRADSNAPKPSEPAATSTPTTNTTITVVVTNQALPFWALQRLAVQVHNSMARAIQPFGTEVDGDTLFAVSTGEVSNAGLNNVDLGTLASETAWDAVLASAPARADAAPRTGAALTSALADACIGRYELAPGSVAELRRNGAGLEVEVTGQDSVYLPAGKWLPLTLVASDEFELATPRADRLHIDRDARGLIAGFTINPGLWPVTALRLPRTVEPESE
ncbi:MAG TPA: P1 family peptidase [Steroidobacteraceae bacterium]|nr:P1 family peptidase [Steroidobacteraceae bacterium]